MMRALQWMGWIAIAALLWWRFGDLRSAEEGDAFPAKPIQVVVPYNAGGGSDSFVRLLSKAIDEENLLPQPLVILNQPGGSGTIGSRFVKESRPDGYRILCLHEAIITAKLSGAVPFGPEAFEPIAQSGNIVLLVLVREDAPYQTIGDLLAAAKEKPNTLTFGANLGEPAHFTAMSLEQASPGSKFNLITMGGGQARYINMIGGHLDAGIFSLAEYLTYRSEPGTPPDKNIRALAVLSPERHPDLPEVQTCVEGGFDVTSSNAYYWWAPKGTPQDAIDTMATALEQAMQNEEVIDTLGTWSIGLEFTRDEALEARIDRRVGLLEPLAVEPDHSLPNFPLYAGLLALGLLVWVMIRPAPAEETPTDPAPNRNGRAVASFLALLGYVLLLQWTALPYALATAAMVFGVGGLICAWQRPRLAPLLQIALLVGLGSEWVFTQVFTVALP